MKHSSENKPPICRKGTISRDKTEFSAILIFGMRHSRRTHLLQTCPLYSNRCCRPISPFEISLTGSCLFFSLCFLRKQWCESLNWYSMSKAFRNYYGAKNGPSHCIQLHSHCAPCSRPLCVFAN